MHNIRKKPKLGKKLKGLNLISKQLKIEEAAWESGFYKRSPKKIKASNLFTSFWKMSSLGMNSLAAWASNLTIEINDIVTKQGINERLTDRAVSLSKKVLEKALNLGGKLKKIKGKILHSSREKFNRILLRDSTLQQLPDHLHKEFSGNYSNGEKKAQLRIQCLYDFIKEDWLDFQVNGYNINDQKAAKSVAPHLEKGDLLLQDLGYFTLSWLRELTEKQYVISLWKSGVSLYDIDNNKLDLLILMKNKRQIDMPVLVGKKEKLPMRLVVRQLPKVQAKKKIEKAKKHRNSRTNHSEEYYQLLKYEIYLTNVDVSVLSPKQVAKTYGLRWHIEILFKSWKSYANFNKVFKKERMKKQRVLFIVYLLLIEFVYLKKVLFQSLKKHLEKNKKGVFISVLKFAQITTVHLHRILNIKSFKKLYQLLFLLDKFMVYEKRNDRKNTIEKSLSFR